MAEQNLFTAALDHSFRHFAIYAQQRMQALNYFLVAAGFLTAGFGASLESNAYEAALAIAGVGARRHLLLRAARPKEPGAGTSG
jgi:hypothetical protein